ncbi:T9SS type B sorting domain-containing protein [Halocola ammonii]
MKKIYLRHFMALLATFFYLSMGYSQDYVGTDFRVAYLKNVNPIFNTPPKFDFSIEALEDAQILIEYGTPADPYYETLDLFLLAGGQGTLTFNTGESLNQENLGVAETRVFHVTSTGDIRINTVHNRLYFADGTSVLPTSSLGTEYRVMSVGNYSQMPTPSLFNIVATANGTEVEVTTTAATSFGPAGTTFNLTLDENEVISIASDDDLTGSQVTSLNGNPIAVFGGRQNTVLPAGCSADSHLFDQMIPLEDWGTVYSIVPLQNGGGDFVRILASEDDTEVFSGCDLIATLDEGEVYEGFFDEATLVSSNNPVLVAAYLVSLSCSNTNSGDPNMRILLPLNQANTKIQFRTGLDFQGLDDDDLKLRYFHVVMPSDIAGSLFYNGTQVGGWQPLPNSEMSFTRIEINLMTDLNVLESAFPFWCEFVGISYADAITMNLGASTTMEVEPPNNVTVDLGPDQGLCPGETIVLDPGLEDEGEWQDGSVQQTFEVTEPGVYSVTFQNACGDGTDQVEILEAEVPEVDLQENYDLCDGEEIEIGVEPEPEYEYLWNTNQSTPSITVSAPGTYTLEVTTGDGCSQEASTEVQLAETQEISISGPDELCIGIQDTLNASGPVGDFTWGDGTSGNLLVINEPGVYEVTWVADGECAVTEEIEVEIADGPLLSLEGPEGLCEGDTAIIEATGEEGSINWSDGSSGQTLQVNNPGVYNATLTAPSGCVTSKSIEIDPLLTPVLSLRDTVKCQGDDAVITIQSYNSDVFWPEFSENNTALISQPGIYEVIGSNSCGTTSGFVNVEDEDCDCSVFVPNAFSPDSDGINEVFKPIFSCTPQEYQLKIFDRWGQLVFQTAEFQKSWNGSGSAGSDYFAPNGVYTYQIEYDNPKRPAEDLQVLTGHLTLIR